MSVRKMKQPNRGIKCKVNTCHYYMPGEHCYAETIEVHPENASCSEDTGCKTFIPHNQNWS